MALITMGSTKAMLSTLGMGPTIGMGSTLKTRGKIVLRNLQQQWLSWSQNSDWVTTSLFTFYWVVTNMVTSSILQAVNSIIVISASIIVKAGLSGLAGQKSRDLVTKSYLATKGVTMLPLFNFINSLLIWSQQPWSLNR